MPKRIVATRNSVVPARRFDPVLPGTDPAPLAAR